MKCEREVDKKTTYKIKKEKEKTAASMKKKFQDECASISEKKLV